MKHNPDIVINDFCKIHDSSVTYKMQDGPIKEHGVNGSQLDDLVLLSKKILEYFNGRFPCRENAMAITKLDECLMWMEARTNDRLKRKVEGKDEK